MQGVSAMAGMFLLYVLSNDPDGKQTLRVEVPRYRGIGSQVLGYTYNCFWELILSY